MGQEWDKLNLDNVSLILGGGIYLHEHQTSLLTFQDTAYGIMQARIGTQVVATLVLGRC